MRRLLWLPLLALAFACRENPSPESNAVTTGAQETATTVATAPVTPPPPAAPSAPAVQGPKLQMVDQASDDPSLAAFRDELLAAVRRRDADAVVAMSDPKIRTSFGDGGGTAELRRGLKEGRFDDLERLLTLGGSFVGEGEGRSFWAPYVYSAWPDAHDAFQSLAVIGKDVPLRETKDPASRVIATLDHDIVTAAAGQTDDAREVKTADGRTGWVDQKQLYSPVGYRAGFLKMNGKWKMNALVAGD
jgi:hypothetical protein